MRRLALFFSFSIICTVFLYGQLITRGDAAAQINIQYKKHSHNHYEFPVPADQPDVYYDSNAQSIIIDGTGYVTFYDVEIMSTTNWMVYVTTQVNSA